MMSVWIHNETGHMMKAQWKGVLLIPSDASSNKPLWWRQTADFEWSWWAFV